MSTEVSGLFLAKPKYHHSGHQIHFQVAKYIHKLSLILISFCCRKCCMIARTAQLPPSLNYKMKHKSKEKLSNKYIKHIWRHLKQLLLTPCPPRQCLIFVHDCVLTFQTSLLVAVSYKFLSVFGIGWVKPMPSGSIIS